MHAMTDLGFILNADAGSLSGDDTLRLTDASGLPTPTRDDVRRESGGTAAMRIDFGVDGSTCISGAGD